MDAAELQRPPPGELFLDHVSHFVRDLDAAAGLLEQLGFVVTPVSIQEVAGSRVGANRCVMLEQGYIEILTPTLQPDPGLRVACFGTPDAEGEHRRLADHGFEPQPVVDLQRELDSNTDRKSTRLNSSHSQISYAVFCLKKKKITSITLNALFLSLVAL